MFLKIFYNFIKEYGKEYRLRLFFIWLFSLFTGAFEFLGLALIFPFVMLLSGDTAAFNFPQLEKLLNILNTGADSGGAMFKLCLLIVCIYIFRDIFMIFCIRYQNNVIANWQYDIYRETLENLIFSPYLKINKMPFGDKGTLFGVALSSSLWSFVHKVVFMFSNIIIAACILGFLFYKFPIPAFVAAVFLGIFGYAQQVFFKRRAKKYGEYILKYTKSLGSLFEFSMKGIKEIKVSKNRNVFIKNLEKNYRDLNQMVKLSSSNGQYPVYITEMGVIISFGILAGLIFCLRETNSGFLVSSLAVVAAVILRLVPILNKLQSSMYSINQSRRSITWFLETAGDLKKEAQKEREEAEIPYEEKIVLKNVSFAYEDGKENTLKDINLEIKKGDFVGVVGLSGAGKTTLIDILTGLNPPTEGEFYIDNNKITKENVRGWHKKIAVLLQDFFVMPLSVTQNVCFGQKESEIDREKLIWALKKADIYDQIEDLDKPMAFSYGQKHRIVLARTFYQDAEVLFLDEATSSLDIETESKVSHSIAKLKGEKTIIAIAHRLSTLKECDYIIYMKNGKIEGKGTFSELKEQHPDFENMIKLSTFQPE